MQLELKPANKLTYKLRLTSQMRLAISLLQMPLVSLKEYVEEQIEENPCLEIENIEPGEKLQENYNFDKEKQDYRKTLITNPVTLQEHLLRQLHLLADIEDRRKMGEFIIENVGDDGILRIV